MPFYINALYGISIFLTGFTGILAIKKDWRSRINQAFFLFTIGAISWMITLYLGFYYAISGAGELSTWYIRGAFAAGVVFMFALSSFFYLFPKKSFPRAKLVENIFIGVHVLLFLLTLFTPFIYAQAASIVNGEEIGEKLGQGYWVFIAFTLLSYTFEIYQSLKKIRASEGIEKQKIGFAFVGLFGFIFCLMMTNLFLPLFGIVIFQLEAVSFSLLFIVPTLYAIRKYRFLDIKLTVSQTLKKGLALLAFGLVGQSFSILLGYFVPNIAPSLRDVLAYGIAIYIFITIVRFFESTQFHRIVGYTPAGLFVETVKEFQTRTVVYTGLEELEKSLHQAFCDKLQISAARLILRDAHDLQKPSSLSKKFQQEKTMLVTKEVEYSTAQAYKNSAYVKELQSLGEVCLPLFHTSGKLIGFFVLGQKPHQDLYTTQELDVLDNFARFLSLTLTGILYNYEVRKEVHEKTVALQDMLKQQKNFLAVTAHELRTPLSIVKMGFAEMHDSLKNQPELSTEVGMVQEGIERLTKVSEKMLAVQEYDAGASTLHKTEVYLHQYFEDIYHIFLPLMKEKMLHFLLQNNIPETLKVCLDTEKTEKILENFITNAVRYTPEKGQIILEAEDEDIRIFFSVNDSGPGIASQEQKNIFQRFRVQNAFNASGTGLGLYLCQKIVELQKGEIWVEKSKQLGGASFCVRLPK